MEKLVDAGLAKAIGLSNFNLRQVKRIYDNARIKPKNLQIELHIYNRQKNLVEYCKQHDIVVTAWGPLGSPGAAAFFQRLGHQYEIRSMAISC